MTISKPIFSSKNNTPSRINFPQRLADSQQTTSNFTTGYVQLVDIMPRAHCQKEAPLKQKMNENKDTELITKKIIRIGTGCTLVCCGMACCGGFFAVVCGKIIFASMLPHNVAVGHFACFPNSTCCGCFHVCFDAGVKVGNLCVGT